MQELVKVTQGALTGEESVVRNIQQRNLVSDSLRLLNQHEAALVKGYPMALLEIFANQEKYNCDTAALAKLYDPDTLAQEYEELFARLMK